MVNHGVTANPDNGDNSRKDKHHEEICFHRLHTLDKDLVDEIRQDDHNPSDEEIDPEES